MREHGSLPRARREGLLEESVGEELLLYDRDSHTAHCLSPIAACIWRSCDGERDVCELALLTGVSEGLVGDALQELCEKGLVDAEPAVVQSAVSGVSRRQVIGQAARVGAGAVAASLVVSATAATPAMASSGEEAEVSCCVCKTGACAEGFTIGQCSEWCEKEGRGGRMTWGKNCRC